MNGCGASDQGGAATRDGLMNRGGDSMAENMEDYQWWRVLVMRTVRAPGNEPLPEKVRRAVNERNLAQVKGEFLLGLNRLDASQMRGPLEIAVLNRLEACSKDAGISDNIAKRIKQDWYHHTSYWCRHVANMEKHRNIIKDMIRRCRTIEELIDVLDVGAFDAAVRDFTAFRVYILLKKGDMTC